MTGLGARRSRDGRRVARGRRPLGRRGLSPRPRSPARPGAPEHPRCRGTRQRRGAPGRRRARHRAGDGVGHPSHLVAGLECVAELGLFVAALVAEMRREIEVCVVVAVGERLAVGGLGVRLPAGYRIEAAPVRQPDVIVAFRSAVWKISSASSCRPCSHSSSQRAVGQVVARLDAGSLGEEHPELGP